MHLNPPIVLVNEHFFTRIIRDVVECPIVAGAPYGEDTGIVYVHQQPPRKKHVFSNLYFPMTRGHPCVHNVRFILKDPWSLESVMLDQFLNDPLQSSTMIHLVIKLNYGTPHLIGEKHLSLCLIEYLL